MVSEQQAVGTVTDPNWIFYPIPDYQAGGGAGAGRLRRSFPDAGQYFGAELT
jgi:hypothetical protein